MNRTSILVTTWIAVCLAGSARGQFVPGRVFVSEWGEKNCGYRLWEIDPETGWLPLFRQSLSGECAQMHGLTFTPDGTGLRAALGSSSQIVEFDSEGNMTVVLDADDGITVPTAIAYDAYGNFYVVVTTGLMDRILRFPATGGPATVFFEPTEEVGWGPIVFAADGDLYYGRSTGACHVLRIAPDGSVFLFDEYTPNFCPRALTADRDGFLYVGLAGGEIFRYRAGDPASRELLVDSGAGVYAMTMSLDQSRIYSMVDGWPSILFGIDPVDGPYANFRNPDGYTREAERSLVLGMVGKWAIHPSQIELAQTIFSPSEDAIVAARNQKSAYEQALADGLGAIDVDGVMVDAASIRIVQNLLDRADLIGM